MLRVIREVQPSWVVGENVLGLVNWSGGLVFHEVQADLEAEGYEVFPFVLPACAVNAPHRRDRVWFVAYNNSIIRGAGRDVKPTEQPRYGESVLPITTKRITPNPNGNGLNGSNGKHEINTSEGGEYALCDFEQMGGNVADTKSQGTWEQSSKNRGRKDRRFDNDGKVWDVANPNGNWRGQKHELCSGGNLLEKRFDKYGNVADTNGFGQGSGCEQYEPNQQGHNIGSNTKGNVADTNDERLEGECRSIGELEGGFGFTGANTRNMQRPSWDNFPTQSPLRSGDDGLSNRLDSITFPKWRNESIKAAGNAIVPQVAFQIFKAIQEYELLYAR